MSKRESPVEMEKGSNKYKDMIHKNSKAYDRGNPTFTFPPKSKIKCSSNKAFECPECGAVMVGTKYSVMIVCSDCKKLVRINKD
jgi:predicted RNA-binding Zn-ribbon protein involved in translation (DUF1610 family)